MRKHFLLLFLMALLPLAGWAADFATEAKVTVDDIYFGLNVAKVGDVKYVTVKVNTNELTEGVDYNLEKTGSKVNYYTTAECTTKASLASGSLTPVPSTYWVKIVPANNNNSNWAAGKVIVKKMPLKVTVGDASKTFNNKGAEDTEEELGEVTGIKLMTKTAWAESALTEGTQFDALKAMMTVGRDAGKDVKYTTSTTPTVTGYAYTITINNTNYSIAKTDIDGSFTINPATFPTAWGTTGDTWIATVTDNELTYNGAARKANVVITDNKLGYQLQAKDLTISYGEGDGIAESQKNYVEGGYKITFKTKGNYTTQDNAVALGFTGNDVRKNKLWIAQKALNIMVDDITMVYDGTLGATTLAKATFTPSGLEGDDKYEVKPFGDNFVAYIPSLPQETTYLSAGKTYVLKAREKTDSDEGGAADFTGTNYSNYKVTFTELGQLTVTQRPVNITVAPKTKSFGTADNPAEWTFEVEAASGNRGATSTTTIGGTETTDKALLEGLYEVVRSNAGTEAVDVYEKVLTLKQKKDDEELTDAEKAVLEQYAINEIKGDFTILTATLTVAPKKLVKTYGEDYSMSDFDIIATNAAGARVVLTTKPTVKFKEAELNTNNPKDAGVYIMVVEGNIAADGYDGANAIREEGQFIINKKKAQIILEDQHLMVGDYEDALLPSKVKFVEDASAEKPVDALIEGDVIGFKLAFNVTANGNEGSLKSANEDDQIVTQDEADVANAGLNGAVNWTGWTVDGQHKFSSDDATKYNNAISGANVTTNTVITAAHVAAAKKHNATLENATKPGLLAAAANTGSFENGVTIYPVASTEAAPNQNANYDITWVVENDNPEEETPANFGKLYVVVNTALALNIDDNDLANIQKLNGKTVPVTINFSNRTRKVVNEVAATTAANAWHTWAADKWNALVLPFDITVAELSNRLGYAEEDDYNYVVVNTIKKDAPAGKFQFQLFTGTIPANTPFMVKTIDNITTLDEDGEPVEMTAISFGTKEIKAPATETATAEFANGFKLVGQYKSFVLDKTSTARDEAGKALYKFLYGDDDSDYNYFGASSKNSWTIVPLDCYVDLSGDEVGARNVVFEFEEADGSTTAIKSISVEANKSVSAKKEGWYTINGVKLQAAPTQKGLYIFNGKKLVVK